MGTTLKSNEIAIDFAENSQTPHDALRRFARTIRLSKFHTKAYTQRNKLAVTVLVNQLNITFHLESRGLGKAGELHPKVDGKSASHTEQMWSALWRFQKDELFALINEKLAAHGKNKISNMNGVQVVSIVSTNQACSSSTGDKEHGCGGIEARDMGMPSGTRMHFGNDYPPAEGVKAKTQLTMRNAALAILGTDSDKADDSTDDELDTNEWRGEDMDEKGVTMARK